MDKQEAHELMEQIKANRVRLNNCPKHRFEVGEPPYRFGEKFTCCNCRGKMGAIYAFEYANGYAAAGGDPNDIIPGFR